MATRVFSKNKDINAIVHTLIDLGWIVKTTGGSKQKIYYPGSDQFFVQIPFTPTPSRARENFVRTVKQCMKRARIVHQVRRKPSRR